MTVPTELWLQLCSLKPFAEANQIDLALPIELDEGEGRERVECALAWQQVVGMGKLSPGSNVTAVFGSRRNYLGLLL